MITKTNLNIVELPTSACIVIPAGTKIIYTGNLENDSEDEEYTYELVTTQNEVVNFSEIQSLFQISCKD